MLHAHKFGSNVWAAVLGTLARTPAIVAHEHTWSFQGQPVRKLLDRRLIAARADAFLAVSEQDRRRMIEIEGIDPGKVIFVPNGIPAAAGPSGADIRGELGDRCRDVPVVGTVCALRPQKALDVLLEAAAKLSGDLPALRVLIVGEGPERAGLEQPDRRARPRRHRDAARAARRRPRPARRHRRRGLLLGLRGDAALDPRVHGGATSDRRDRVGGIPDLIEPEVEGLLVEPRDPGRASPPRSRASSPTRISPPRSAPARGERQHAEFDIGVTVRAIERIYEGLASGRTAAELGAGA